MTETDRIARLVSAEGIDRFRRLGSILEAVEQQGSLNRAASVLHISYRQSWGLIKKAEEMLGTALLTRKVGGTEGGGAALTESARDLLIRYRLVRQGVDQILTGAAEPDPGRPVLIASTIGPVETGILGALETAFHSASGIWVRHIAAGTGQALEIARTGRADLVLAHAPEEEARFVKEGWGVERHPLMINDFLLCGPVEDPAQVRTAQSAADAMRRIAQSGAPFLSRGDRSGTHRKEEALWRAAGVDPVGPWYAIFAQGAMGSATTLREAARRNAYTLVDRATVAAAGTIQTQVLLEGDPALENLFSLVSLHPERLPQVNHAGADRFIRWATGRDGQAVVQAWPHFRPVLAE